MHLRMTMNIHLTNTFTFQRTLFICLVVSNSPWLTGINESNELVKYPKKLLLSP